MKVVIKRALKVLLGEKRATHLFFMTRRGIRNLEITKFVIKIAYGKYIGGGGKRLVKIKAHSNPSTIAKYNTIKNLTKSYTIYFIADRREYLRPL
ncbi:hypothetical protein [Helicobacter rappini]|uniref:hypothetical protein n=1 Tax=Helicobacter rappini TaxID=95150 RepID=UPI001F23C4A1|nr:hypothetical protein [Helicobacter rappini]